MERANVAVIGFGYWGPTLTRGLLTQDARVSIL